MIGHNPKTSQNQADELQDITALLQSLPRVAAPADFHASLKARITAATAEEKEFAGVTALVKELPRVAAPADFDFRLRARIAQAKAEQEQAAAGWFAGWFGQSFSWLQASAGMAAMALVVTIVTWGVLRSSNTVEPTGPIVAQVPSAPATNRMAEVASNTANEETKSAMPKAVMNNNTGALKTASRSMKYTPVPVVERGNNEINNNSLEAPAVVAANRTVIIKHRSGEARVVNLSEYNLGLQTASLRTASTAANRPVPEMTLSANIY